MFPSMFFRIRCLFTTFYKTLILCITFIFFIILNFSVSASERSRFPETFPDTFPKPKDRPERSRKAFPDVPETVPEFPKLCNNKKKEVVLMVSKCFFLFF